MGLLLNILDAWVSILVLAPLVVAYWRGTFLVIALHLLPEPENRQLSLALSCVIALIGELVIIYFQDVFRNYVHSRPSPITELFLKRAYTYIYGFVIVNHWRGVWEIWDDAVLVLLEQRGLLDKKADYAFRDGYICFLTGIGVLIIFRGVRNAISPPVVAASDLSDGFFAVPTRFRVKRSDYFFFFLDALFGICVIGSAVVFVVRGFWKVMDKALDIPGNFSFYPASTIPANTSAVDVIKENHPAWTYLASFILGIVLVFLTLILQKPCAKISAKLEQVRNVGTLLKIIFEDCFMFIGMAAGINIWRGVWGACDHFIFPSDLMISAWTCHLFGITGVMLMFHGCSVLVKGVEVDGEYSNGDGCFLPASSLTIFQHHAGQTHRKQLIVLPSGHTLEDGVDLINGETPRDPQAKRHSNTPKLDEMYNDNKYPYADNPDLTPWERKLEHRMSIEHPN